MSFCIDDLENHGSHRGAGQFLSFTHNVEYIQVFLRSAEVVYTKIFEWRIATSGASVEDTDYFHRTIKWISFDAYAYQVMYGELRAVRI